MKRLKKGPELKMPEVKAPDAVADLYYDLRDRRLLPLVALVVVAIVAVPFLLGGDAEEPALPPAAPGAAGLGATGAEGSDLVVVEAKPGLRSYRKRLKGRTPTDPFAQQYAERTGGSATGSPSATSSGSGSASESISVTELDQDTTESDEVVTQPKPGSGGNEKDDGGSADTEGLRLFAFRPDIRFGVAGSGQLRQYEHLPLGTVLPKRNPVIVFIGVSDDGKRVGFDVSHEVAMVKGPGRCIGGHQNCSLLSLRAGQAADILTGSPGRSFRLKVTGIDFIEVEPPKDAASSAATGGWGSGGFQNFSK